MPRSAKISSHRTIFERVAAVATAIVSSATLQQAADLLGQDVSTLRVWRKEPGIREQVRLLREQSADERSRRKCYGM